MNRPLSAAEQQLLNNVIATLSPAQEIFAAIQKSGGRVYIVGGTVRDLILGQPINDLDCEVHGLTLDALRTLLEQCGHVALVGKSFGVLKLYGLSIDWSLPRTDLPGRKPRVFLDPHLSINDALRRRDITMNAMAIDVQTFELIDPFNGQQDMQEHILRSPDPAFFGEDPLRFFRIMHFIGRFSMEPDETLNHICTTMDISTVSRERIEKEFEKLLLLSPEPSRGIRWLKKIGRLREILPELAATVGVPQNPDWHPEGDVFEHTMQALDAAAALSIENKEQKLIIMYATLCHDLGKAVTTTTIDHKIVSYNHENEGVPLAKSLLKRITHTTDILEQVPLLVKYHMAPGNFIAQHASSAAYKRLARKLAPANLHMLAWLALADKRGRNSDGHKPLATNFDFIQQFEQKAQEYAVLFEQEEPILQGRDLLDIVPAGPELGKLVKQAYEIQIEKNIQDKEELKKRVLSGYKKNI